ncbi:MAG: hypothetical protein IKI19_02125 [Prevotella sp.]|nr:hypothetical protein [Prevotella sp.]
MLGKQIKTKNTDKNLFPVHAATGRTAHRRPLLVATAQSYAFNLKHPESQPVFFFKCKNSPQKASQTDAEASLTVRLRMVILAITSLRNVENFICQVAIYRIEMSTFARHL